MADEDNITAHLVKAHVHEAMERTVGWQDYAMDFCETPIERVLFLALAVTAYDLGGINLCLEEPASWPIDLSEYSPCDVALYPQAKVGRYRADFLLGTKTYSAPSWLVVECDGHNFHERTKKQAARDRSRDRWMVDKGFTVLRFTGSEIWAAPSSCAFEIYRAASKAIWPAPALSGGPVDGAHPQH